MTTKRNFKITCLVLLVSASLMLLSSCGKDIVLSEKYVIIVSQNATETEKKAAAEFSRLLALSTPVTLRVVTDNQALTSYEIVIGNTNRDLPSATDDLQSDGFTVQTAGDKLFIRGGTKKGCLYGVYEFFEKYLGYRCYSPTVFTYPRLDRVKVASGIRNTQIPVNVHREIVYHVTKDLFYADWHRLHQGFDWGIGGHSFQWLVSPDIYGKDHPEYFSLINGVRMPRQADHNATQLCLSNPDVLRIVIEELEKRMQDNPTIYWSVSQNDADGDNCTCDQCAALDKASGSPSGSLITFVNAVAKHFPDKTIATFAYRYSRAAPTAVNPDPNVNITLCSIECNRNIPIADDTANMSFCRDIEDWSAKTNNLLIWDYVIQFSNLLSPFPNLRTLQPNIQYFVRNNVTSHFQQGNWSKGGEFSELRPYLIAKLLWNPDVDIQAVMDDFLKGYYEDAAPYVALYINLMHDELEKSKIPLSIYGHPYDHFENGFLRLELAEQYEQFFDKAEQAVKDKPDVLKRVQIARLPLTFSLFEIDRKRGERGEEETRIFETIDGSSQPRTGIMDKLDSFTKLSKQEVRLLHEWKRPPEEYDKEIRTFMMFKQQAALLAQITIDGVHIGDEASEKDHNMEAVSSKSKPSEYNNLSWRHAENSGYFMYKLKSLPDETQSLYLLFRASDEGQRTFDILIDGRLLTTVSHNQKVEDVSTILHSVIVPIPEAFTKGKNDITVKFQPKPGNTAGGIYDLRLIRTGLGIGN